MAEQAGYTGAQYATEFYQKEGESLFDYMRRLSALRAQGVLGGGGMLDAAPRPQNSIVGEVMSGKPLGEVQLNVPSGGSSDSSNVDRRTPEEQRRDTIRALSRQGGMEDVLEGGARLLGFGGLFDVGRAFAANELERDMADRAYPEGYMEEVMDSPKAIVDMYSKGGFGDVNPLMDGISYDKAGNSLFYSIPEALSKGAAQLFGTDYSDPMQKAYLYTKPAGQYMDFGFNRLPSPMEQAVAMQQAQAELAARQAALGTQMQADMGMLSSSSPSDSVSAGRTSSSDISYSSARDRSSTTGYDFNKD